MVLERLRSQNLCAKFEKCTIATQQVSFLGHVVSATGIIPDPAKIAENNEKSCQQHHQPPQYQRYS